MTGYGRLARVLHAAIWLAVTCAPAPALAQPESKMPRVRTESQIVRDAVAWGLGESATFRALHEALDATDGLLYIDEGTCRQVGMPACLYLSVQLSGPFRLLRMKVSPRRAPGCALTESIGHELKHVLEVLGAAHVRSGTDMFFLFERIGTKRFGAFETQAAIDAGKSVHNEACGDDPGQLSRWERTSGSANRHMTLSIK